jgi:peptide deformylase
VLPGQGTVRPMVRWGEPVMHRVQQPVTTYDDGLRALVADLAATMYAADGVGLAACQVGVDLAVFVFDCPDSEGIHHQGVVCNPVLELPTGKGRKLDVSEEGCLSLPGAFVPCARPSYARVDGFDLAGAPVTFTGERFLARCLQHETDHCNGTVFGDRLNRRGRRKLFAEAEDAAEEFPAGWPA